MHVCNVTAQPVCTDLISMVPMRNYTYADVAIHREESGKN